MAEAYQRIDHSYDVVVVGAGFELNTNKRWSTIVAIVPLLLTALFWAYICFGDQL